MDLIQRPRRLRGSENLRKMVRETRMDKSSLIYPLFVKEGTGIEEEIPSMEGQFRYSVDRLPFELERLQNAGVNSIMLFGIPDHKDEVGSGAYDPNGIVQKALREAKKQFPDMYYITDVCMCEYTSHGHCGVLCGHDVNNDATLELLAKTAVSHVEAGADMVAPSDMMDGRVRAIREALDANGHYGAPIMSYAVKDVYKRQVIVLIDEYDVPLAKANENGYYDEMVLLIRNLFENALKTNNSLKFAVLTGCLRIAKESIFTGLNNFKVYSITAVSYTHLDVYKRQS